MKTKTSEVKAHAKFGASKSERWLNCPGSMALEEKAPPQRESEYAAEGTHAHGCFEFMLKNRKQPVNKVIAAARKKWSEEMVQHATESTGWVINRAMELGTERIICETRVNASHFTKADQFGTVDAAVLEDFGTLVVIDYKYGAGVAVDPEGNSQLIYYALGIAAMHDYDFETVELVVIQPRAYHESGETVRTWTCSMAELRAWEDKFRAGVAACEDPLAPLAAGKWCKFCPAATLCPELKENAMKQAQIVFSDESGITSLPEPLSIAIPNLGVILEATYKLEAWISKVRDHAIHVLEKGVDVPGYKLVAKNSPRRWIDQETTLKEAKKRYGALALTEPKLLSPAQLERAIGKTDKKLEEFISKRVTNESSGTTLVPETDKRPAVRSLAENAFADIPMIEERKEAPRSKQTVPIAKPSSQKIRSYVSRSAKSVVKQSRKK